MGSLLGIEDLSEGDIDAIFDRARTLCEGGREPASSSHRLLGMIFFEPSLRTRVGFLAAAVRSGWRTVELQERRHSPVSEMEPWPDTLRVMAGYCDALVVRPGRPLSQADLVTAGSCPLINGGDFGPTAQHPTQALIDAFAIERFVGKLTDVNLAIVGDPRMRAVRSLLALLARRNPASLSLLADDEHWQQLRLPETLRARVERRTWADLGAVDVLYIAGIPHRTLPLERRRALLATRERASGLPPHCILLSPMPVIDELDPDLRWANQNRMFDQSDLGLYVRMAVLAHVMRERE